MPVVIPPLPAAHPATSTGSAFSALRLPCLAVRVHQSREPCYIRGLGLHTMRGTSARPVAGSRSRRMPDSPPPPSAPKVRPSVSSVAPPSFAWPVHYANPNVPFPPTPVRAAACPRQPRVPASSRPPTLAAWTDTLAPPRLSLPLQTPRRRPRTPPRSPTFLALPAPSFRTPPAHDITAAATPIPTC